MTRRELLGSAALGAAAMAAGTTTSLAQGAAGRSASFKLRYAPHFGMFKHHAGDDPLDQLRFAADQGFTAWEDNGMKARAPADQERIAATMSELGILMGVFVVNPDTAWGPALASGKAEEHQRFLDECRSSVEVAQRVAARWMTVVPGTVNARIDMGYQTTHVVEALRRACEIFEPHGLVMVLEPLNFRDHPGMFLTRIAQAYEVCRAVGSPACKILNDLYHQQITEGNLIPNIDRAWDEIVYFQVGDNPGRREPTTGEINYRNIFRHIHAKGFTGVVGMEHGVRGAGRDGEKALIAAYREVDDFPV